jgi:hypothetical protein
MVLCRNPMLGQAWLPKDKAARATRNDLSIVALAMRYRIDRNRAIGIELI